MPGGLPGGGDVEASIGLVHNLHVYISLSLCRVVKDYICIELSLILSFGTLSISGQIKYRQTEYSSN